MKLHTPSLLAGALVAFSVQALAEPEASPATTQAATHASLSTAPARQVPSGKAKVTILAEGREAFLGHLWMDGGGGVPEHRDPTEEFIYVLEGSGTLHVDDAVFELKAGDAVYMPANAKVRFENGQAPLVALQVFAGPESAAKYQKWEEVR